jgi:spore germination protein
MHQHIKAMSLLSLFLAGLLVSLAEPAPTAGAAAPIPLRWFYFVNGKSNAALLANYKNIDVISPDFYRLQNDGTIRGSNKPDVTNFARSKGIKVVPMIQNDPSKDDFNKLLADPVKFKSILDTIEKQVVDNNYDGYQIDFEDLNTASETLLTSFIAELSNRLRPRGKLVTMAVVSRTSNVFNGQYSAAYNYAKLAPYLDLVTIMTYDYSYSSGAPGPVAPVTWQERVLNYATPLFGANKILLGIPFYGYDWNITKRQDDPNYKASSRSFDETMKLGTDNNGTFGFDAVSKTPYLNYLKDNEIHQVWFENPISLQAKFDLMKRQQVRGFAVWRLGFEGDEFWPVIKNLVVPTKPVVRPGPDTSYRVYYPQTGHTLSNVFKRYWDKYGGLAQFGYPWTEEFEEVSPSEPGKTFTVQDFERNRFEYHPEFSGTQYEVLLGLLGRQVTAGREAELPFQRVTPEADITSLLSTTGNMISIKNLLNAVERPKINYYPQTGHTLGGAFRDYWEKNGGLAMFGYPISQEFAEVNPADGKTYTVQYFERNRFEFHPEFAGTKYAVLMGLLGNQIMAEKDWL